MAKQSRRVFLARIAAGGAAVGILQTLGCGGGGDSFTCNDNVDQAARGTRTALQYVDTAADPNKKCIDCVLFTGNATACGTCSAVPGPIHPSGSCTAFAPKPA
ncbi:MAG: hypothetical protein H6721_24430 [Sandaracinus sp.]|nr:hypothetical protein [Sandaracinus sp.]MCB9615956.1 hypothetical protein [Sandaracinus sp.]MCB9621402.1 hypothetical protein [Sandaracinus sp.]MCB9622881.1 hypothetical protein [Sandaracinus sp.]MCB9635279.1 hypothetical protein [Sandaracinus sp.]